MHVRDAVTILGWAMAVVGACVAFGWLGLAAAGVLTTLLGLFALNGQEETDA